MKNQYFGDARDYLKYAVLRALTAEGFSILVDWMLTPDDGSGDGQLHQYLDRLDHRERDPELYDWLQEWRRAGAKKDVATIGSAIIPGATFTAAPMPTHEPKRRARFGEVMTLADRSDVIFFDPDNGIETEKPMSPTRLSAKHVRVREIAEAYERGLTVVIYQHMRTAAIAVFAEKYSMLNSAGVRQVMALISGPIMFVVAMQDRHAIRATAALRNVEARWPDIRMLTPTDIPTTLEKRGSVSPRTPRSRTRRSTTTTIGFVNHRQQEVVKATGLPGTDHGQKIYILRCQLCDAEYGVNGSSIFEKKCPNCQRGAKGIEGER